MLEGTGAVDQAAHLLAAQDHRQRAGHAHGAHLGHQLGTVQRHLEEELQSGDRGVERDRRDAPIHAVQLVAAQVLDTGGVGRAAQPSGEMPHGTNVAALSLGRELAHPHVFDHASTQR